MTLSLRGCSHPPNPGRAKTRLFPGGDGETHCSKVRSNDPSKLARALLGRGLIDLQVRAWTSTAFLRIRLVWCARSASKGDQQPSRPLLLVCALGEQRKLPSLPIHYFAEPSSGGPCGFTSR